MLILLIVSAWVLAGFASFIYWLSKEQDVTTGDLGLGCVASVFGPLIFFIGIMDNEEISTKVWIKKRGTK